LRAVVCATRPSESWLRTSFLDGAVDAALAEKEGT